MAPMPLSPLAVLGTIYPDTCISNQFTWRATHGQGLEIYHSLPPEAQAALRPFFAGLFSHGVNPRGLDYYGDLDYEGKGTGFAFFKAEALKHAVARTCGLEERHGLWKAHNFIEMGMEVRYSKKYPELNRYLLQVLETAHEEIKVISDTLSRFYKVPAEQLQTGFLAFRNFLTPCPWDPGELAGMFVKQLNYRLGERQVDIKAVTALIEEAAGLTEQDGEGFIENVVQRLRPELPQWLGPENHAGEKG